MMRAVILIALAAIAGCNQREPVVESPVSPSQPTGPQPSVVSVVLSPAAVDGGRQAAGTVVLSGPAPSAVVVSLSSSATAVASVPATVTISAGSDRVSFTVTTRTTAADQTVVITASTPRGSAPARVTVWAAHSNSTANEFRFASDPGNSIGRGTFERLTPPASSFGAGCGDNRVAVTVSTPDASFWQMTFRAAAKEPLRIGRYEGAGGSYRDDHSRPLLFFGGRSRYCNADAAEARFEVHDIDFQDERVNRLHISFEHRCLGDAGWLSGEVRVVGSPAFAPNCPG